MGYFLLRINLLITIPNKIITSDPTTTGNKIKSKDKSIDIATIGFEAAGGCMILKCVIIITATPTEAPNEIYDNPKNSLKTTPTKIDTK